jgi:hypothetical protein
MIKKRIPFYNFKEEIADQLQGHFVYYQHNKKPIEREIIIMLANIITEAELYVLPSDYDEYLPIIRVDYGYQKEQRYNWMVQFKQEDISYAIVNTNNKEIIEKVLLLSNSQLNTVNSLDLVFYKYQGIWVFPTHCLASNKDGEQVLNFLNNKRTDIGTINEYVEIMDKLQKKMNYYIENKKIKMTERVEKIKTKNTTTQVTSYVPEIFYKVDKPVYKITTLKQFKEAAESDRILLRKFAKSVLN